VGCLLVVGKGVFIILLAVRMGERKEMVIPSSPTNQENLPSFWGGGGA